MEEPIRVGIDVSAATLDVAIDAGRGPVWTGSFGNDAAGHQRLLRVLGRKRRAVRVCLEATGVYHLDVALALHAAPGIEVMVANPRATKDFARATARSGRVAPHPARRSTSPP